MPEIEFYGPKDAIFGKYKLGKLLGCGAFAKVYHARDVWSGVSVAVKIINKNKIIGTGLMSNIKREISIMRRLRHPHIVKLHEVLASKSKIYIVMEFAKGGELFAKVANGRFSEDNSRRYFQQLISAVSYCHSRGIFHRDLKPENLLVDENGNLKVSDFGLSAVGDQIQLDGLLHTLCGTPAYVAPEILTKKGYDGAKVDVWSCGVILFVLNAGYLPFNDPNLMAMYKKIYRGKYRCPKWMSPDLKRFLARILETDPVKRITVDEILKDPWFRKGDYQETKFHENWLDKNSKFKNDCESRTMNAFDIISFASGLNLSGLFDEAHHSVEDCERFVSTETPEKTMEKIEELCEMENLKLKKKKEVAMEVEGGNGNAVIGIEVLRLTEEMVVVETKRRGVEEGYYWQIWKSKLKAQLVGPSADATLNSGTDAAEFMIKEEVQLM